MTKITIPAARVRQGDLVLYATSIKVKDLVTKSFYTVETLDPDNSNDKGYQRLLNTARAKKLADYILKGQDSSDAFLPRPPCCWQPTSPSPLTTGTTRSKSIQR